MRKSLIILAFFTSLTAFGQLETDADFRRTVYRNEATLGVVLHTRSPWPGINFRRLHYTDGFTKWGYEISHTVYRNPREIKYPAQNLLNSRAFAYGKVNEFFAFRWGYGRERILYDKTDRGTVSISLQTYGGVNFGFLKPIYVVVQRAGVQGVERYSPEEHDNLFVLEEASYFRGFDEIQFRPGVYGKVGVSFDYNWSDEKVTTLEAGFILDYYPSWFGLYEDPAPVVMDTAENLTLWWQFYLSINFGKKWN